MEADYVIVGAGSAGCAMAWRLTEAGRSVIVIEHGGSDAGPFINMPGALSYPMGMTMYDWGLRTEPEPHLDGRRMVVPRGKVVGGSSSIKEIRTIDLMDLNPYFQGTTSRIGAPF